MGFEFFTLEVRGQRRWGLVYPPRTGFPPCISHFHYLFSLLSIYYFHTAGVATQLASAGRVPLSIYYLYYTHHEKLTNYVYATILHSRRGYRATDRISSNIRCCQIILFRAKSSVYVGRWMRRSQRTSLRTYITYDIMYVLCITTWSTVIATVITDTRFQYRYYS